LPGPAPEASTGVSTREIVTDVDVLTSDAVQQAVVDKKKNVYLVIEDVE